MSNSSSASKSPSIGESRPCISDCCSNTSAEEFQRDTKDQKPQAPARPNNKIRPKHVHKIIQKYGTSIKDMMTQIRTSYSNKYALSEEFNQFYRQT